MRTLLLLLWTAALPELAANTTLYVNTANTGLDSGRPRLTNESDDSAGRACTSPHPAESNLPADITAGGDQGAWTILCGAGVAGTTAVTFSGTTTSATYCIAIMVAPLTKHSGVYTTENYRLVAANSTPLIVADNYMRVTGLQIYRTASHADLIAAVHAYDQTGATAFRLSDSIITVAANHFYTQPIVLINSSNMTVYLWIGHSTFAATSASSDETVPARLQDIAVITTTVTNVTAGREAFHTPLSSALIDAGTDTYADRAPMDFTTDTTSMARVAPWDIGADEYAASVGTRKRVGAIQ